MVIEVKEVEKVYKKFKLNCSLNVKEGTVTGIIGENGAGKSTTFKAILDLISIDKGNIKIFGKEHNKLSIEDKEKIGVVLADSGFSGYLTVKDIISIMQGFYKDFNNEKFMDMCEKMNLPLDKKVKEFSTGMKAKLKVIVALSHDTKLLILDEPTSGLDVVVRDEILDLLREYMEEDNERSILISSHISSDLEGLCDDIYMINDGKIIMHEDTDVILSEYGILKLDEKEYSSLDKSHVLRVIKEKYSYKCLTNNKDFYRDNYHGIVIEKGNIDEIILMTIKGEEV